MKNKNVFITTLATLVLAMVLTLPSVQADEEKEADTDTVYKCQYLRWF